MQAEDFVTVENLDPEPYTYRQGGRTIVLKPNVPMVVPFEHIVKFAGNPWATSERGARQAEVRRVKGIHGITNEDQWERRPHIKVTNQDDEIIPTVLWDPEGVSGIVGPNADLDTSDRGAIITAIERMKGQINQLSRKLNEAESAESADARSDARPDAPRKATAKPRPAPTDIRQDSPRTVPTS